jgi:hypothetical protein
MRSADRLALVATVSATLICVSCGGSSGSANQMPGGNSQAIVVNGGPEGNYANGLFTTVSICAPGTSNCQSVSGVLVDTGSYGLRILASALSQVNSGLQQQQDVNGNSVFECAQFVDSVVWGPVKNADVQIGNERAPAIPVEVIDSSSVPLPASCKAKGPAEQDIASLGANGILGIGLFLEDCGSACAVSGSANPGFYYGCSGSACTVIAQSTAAQIQNPIGSFSSDNNGVVVQLPTPAQGSPSVSGSLTFGVGTADDNALGSSMVFAPDSFGNMKTSFKNQTYASFLDTGSNGIFFLDSSITGIPDCSNAQKGFYCPSAAVNLSATNQSGGSSSAVNFTIGNASQLFSQGGFAFPTLGGPNPATFDWGLPFFFGRKVFIAIEGRQTPGGPGPYWAF